MAGLGGRGGAAAGNRPDGSQGGFVPYNCIGQGGVHWLVGEVLFTGEKAQHRSALPGVVVANRAAQHRIASFERVQNGANRYWALDGDTDLAIDVRQRSQMVRNDDS